MNRTPLDRTALILLIVGAVNWLLIGLFNYNLVDNIASLIGLGSFFSNVIYSIVGLSGLYAISLLFRESEAVKEQS